MKLTDLQIDIGAVDNGAWIEDIPDMEGTAFLVRGTEYAPYQKAVRKAMVTRGRKQRLQSQIDMEGYLRMQNTLAAEHLLLDWRGIEDSAGEPIDYSKDLALELLTDRKYIPIQTGVNYAIAMVDAGLVDHREESREN